MDTYGSMHYPYMDWSISVQQEAGYVCWRYSFEGVWRDKWSPQRSVLWPIFNLVFIEEIDQGFLHTNITLFADYTRMMMIVKEPADIVRLQEDLNKIYEWANTNNMMFNADKFELLRYGPGNVGHPKYLSSECMEIHFSVMFVI